MQGEANDWALRTLAHCTAPTSALNLSGPQVAIRDVARGLGERLGKAPILVGKEAQQLHAVHRHAEIERDGIGPADQELIAEAGVVGGDGGFEAALSCRIRNELGQCRFVINQQQLRLLHRLTPSADTTCRLCA